MTNKHLRISASGLSVLQSCRRCFWIEHVHGIKRPRGIFPSLPGAMDKIVKTHFDLFRGKGVGLPPEIRGLVDGKLVPQNIVDKWRDWRSAPMYKHTKVNATVIGAFDDAVVNRGGRYAPLDYKTKGSVPNPGDSEKYYQLQMDVYDLLLESLGLETQGCAYLIYYIPAVIGKSGAITFTTHVDVVSTSSKRPLSLVEEATELIQQKEPPGKSSDCEYCKFGMDYYEQGRKRGRKEAHKPELETF